MQILDNQDWKTTILKTSSLSLRAKMVVDSFVSGIHASTYKGFSTDFSHHRQYSLGDPVKMIDWKIYAKNDKYVVKEFLEDTILRAYILLDTSKSMGFVGNVDERFSKFDYAKLLAASLAYLLIQQHDTVGLGLINDRLEHFLPCIGGHAHLYKIFDILENAKISSTTNIHSALTSLGNRLKRRSLIVLISDLFDDKDEVMRTIKYLNKMHHEIMIFQILDPKEIILEGDGEIDFTDIETGDTLIANSSDIKNVFEKSVADFLKFYKTNCDNLGIDYLLMNTDKQLYKALSAYLFKRMKMR